MNRRRVLSSRSQFFHSRLCLPGHAKLRSTIQRLGITLKGWSSLRLAICRDVFTQEAAHALREGLADIAAVCQQALHPVQPRLTAPT